MSPTSVSFLERLRLRPDAAGWEQLVALYTPLIRAWLRRHALQASDIDDVVQDILTVVVRELPGFQHNRQRGAFRSWLRNITVNRLRTFWRSRKYRPVATGDSDFEALLDQLADPASGLSRQWDEEHDRHVLRRLLEMIEPEFTRSTWDAFRQVALEGRAEEAVAAELGMSVNAVFIAKSRVLSRLRQEKAGLVE
jgi:RNA polymerase sigma-70 factor (ECF subfamily)